MKLQKKSLVFLKLFFLVLYFGENLKIYGTEKKAIKNQFPSNSDLLYKNFVLFCLKSNPLFEHPNGGMKLIKILLKALKDSLLVNNNNNNNNMQAHRTKCKYLLVNDSEQE